MHRDKGYGIYYKCTKTESSKREISIPDRLAEQLREYKEWWQIHRPYYTDAAFTNKFDFSAKITANVTLYAKWTENEKEDDVWKLILYVDNKTALVGGKEVEMDVPATILNDRTMTPSRFVAENLGAEVAWNEDEQLVTITLGDIEIKLTIDSTTAYVNGEAVELDQPATIVNDRTLAPARFVAENLGAKVEWDEAEQMITVTK